MAKVKVFAHLTLKLSTQSASHSTSQAENSTQPWGNQWSALCVLPYTCSTLARVISHVGWFSLCKPVSMQSEVLAKRTSVRTAIPSQFGKKFAGPIVNLVLDLATCIELRTFRLCGLKVKAKTALLICVSIVAPDLPTALLGARLLRCCLGHVSCLGRLSLAVWQGMRFEALT